MYDFTLYFLLRTFYYLLFNHVNNHLSLVESSV